MQYNFSSLMLSWLCALAFLWLVVSWTGGADQEKPSQQNPQATSHSQVSSIIPIARNQITN